jgi:hypothetical protein
MVDTTSPRQMSHNEDYSQLTTLIGQHYPFTPDNEKGSTHVHEMSVMIHPPPEYSTIPNFTVADDIDQANYTPAKLNDAPQQSATPCKATLQDIGIESAAMSSLRSSQAIEFREESEEVHMQNNNQEEMAGETSSEVESVRHEYQEQTQGTLIQIEDESKYLTTPNCEATVEQTRALTSELGGTSPDFLMEILVKPTPAPIVK